MLQLTAKDLQLNYDPEKDKMTIYAQSNRDPLELNNHEMDTLKTFLDLAHKEWLNK